MFITRLSLIMLPIIYMVLIWLQSSHFDPQSIHNYSGQISMNLILFIGICLELAHLFEFGLLYLFIVMAFLTFGKLSGKRELLAAVIAIGFGFIDEVHQHYVPFRSFSVFDLFKDIVGVLASSYIIHKNYFSRDRSRLGSFLRGLTILYYKRKNDMTF